VIGLVRALGCELSLQLNSDAMDVSQVWYLAAAGDQVVAAPPSVLAPVLVLLQPLLLLAPVFDAVLPPHFSQRSMPPIASS